MGKWGQRNNKRIDLIHLWKRKRFQVRRAQLHFNWTDGHDTHAQSHNHITSAQLNQSATEIAFNWRARIAHYENCVELWNGDASTMTAIDEMKSDTFFFSSFVLSRKSTEDFLQVNQLGGEKCARKRWENFNDKLLTFSFDFETEVQPSIDCVWLWNFVGQMIVHKHLYCWLLSTFDFRPHKMTSKLFSATAKFGNWQCLGMDQERSLSVLWLHRKRRRQRPKRHSSSRDHHRREIDDENPLLLIALFLLYFCFQSNRQVGKHWTICNYSQPTNTKMKRKKKKSQEKKIFIALWQIT